MSSGAYELTHPNVCFPAKCQYYSVPDGYYKNWDEPTRAAATMLRDGYSLRYVGSLVATSSQSAQGRHILVPADDKSPNGKLRLMYEGQPSRIVAEQAGGAASSGQQRILDIQPELSTSWVPLMLGPADVVEKTVSILNS